MTDRDSQHFLQRFILEGFYSKKKIAKKKKIFHTWVFHKDKPPYEPNTTKIGAEHHFHGKKDKSILDLNITKYVESNSLVECVKKLRSQLCNGKIPIEKIEVLEQFIRFQIFGTRNARLFFNDFIRSAIEISFSEKIIDEIVASKEYKDFCFEESKRMGLEEEEVEEWCLKVLNEQKQKYKIILKEEKSFNQMIADTHNIALSKIVSYIMNINKDLISLSPLNLSWYLFISNDKNLILGDSCCFVKNLNEKFSVWANSMDEISQVVFPISSTHLIIGSRKYISSVDFEEINLNSCSCSREFFVSGRNTEKEIMYKSKINTAYFINNWDDILTTVRRELVDKIF